jgi:anthranilate 1,2-dioxygenase small subunit
VEQNLPLALMMDDNRARIEDRANYVTKVWAGTFEPYSTRHFVQSLGFEEISPSAYAVTSNLLVIYTAETGKSGVLAAGTYQDVVSLLSDRPAFISKKVVLDTVVTPRYVVYPL